MAQNPPLTLLDFPYPAIRVEAKNPAYARMMLSNIGEQSSEMSSYALYLYNYTITVSEPEISESFRAVMDAERKHLELFCNAAFQLGADPRLWAVTGNAAQPMRYWSPAQLTYTANTKALLQNALALERATIAKYERQTQEIRDDGLLFLLRRILLDESMHVEIFRALLADLDARAAAAAPVPAAQLALPAVAAAPVQTAPSVVPQEVLPQQAQI